MAIVPTLSGKRIILRRVRESDIDDRLSTGRHHEFVHMCGGDSLAAPEYPGRSFWEEWYLNQSQADYSWIIDLDGKCIGCTKLHNLSLADKCGTYAIGIFDPANHSKGIGAEATGLVLRYGFEELALHRIELKVLEYNRRGIRCYEKCGFQREGILRDSAFIDGAYHSDIVMSMLEEEYRAIYAG